MPLTRKEFLDLAARGAVGATVGPSIFNSSAARKRPSPPKR